MSGHSQYEIWETGKQSAPPNRLMKQLNGDERLLWTAVLPSGHLQKRWLLGIIVGVSITAFLAFAVPWGQTMTEYCQAEGGSRCESVYILAWPLLACFVIFTIHLVGLFWKNRASPWNNLYGITTLRALRIDGNKPEKVQCVHLERGQARMDWIGDVRFDASRTGLSFMALDDQDARRAVYWANQGRFRADPTSGAER